jgi:hypothetical protein
VKEVVLYAAAAAVYIALGVFVPQVLISWPVGATYVLLAVWLLPALVRRVR